MWSLKMTKNQLWIRMISMYDISLYAVGGLLLIKKYEKLHISECIILHTKF